MIFVTGDTHGKIDFDKLSIFASKNKNLTKNDYVIIAGDFGGVWSEKTLEKDILPYKSLPFTILFVDGNHENFDLLNSYSIEIWNGGKVHKIADNIYHLMRGQIFTIDRKTFFAFGGATSIDKEWRTIGISWWKQENPSYNEIDDAIVNLQNVNNEVDYIITHTCDEKALRASQFLKEYDFKSFPENKLFNYFEENIKYKHWYFGHYHLDGDVENNKTVIYNEIIML